LHYQSSFVIFPSELSVQTLSVLSELPCGGHLVGSYTWTRVPGLTAAVVLWLGEDPGAPCLYVARVPVGQPPTHFLGAYPVYGYSEVRGTISVPACLCSLLGTACEIPV